MELHLISNYPQNCNHCQASPACRDGGSCSSTRTVWLQNVSEKTKTITKTNLRDIHNVFYKPWSKAPKIANSKSSGCWICGYYVCTWMNKKVSISDHVPHLFLIFTWRAGRISPSWLLMLYCMSSITLQLLPLSKRDIPIQHARLHRLAWGAYGACFHRSGSIIILLYF